MKSYRQKELAEFSAHIETAKQMWRDAAHEQFKKHGDQGSVIIGDGIAVEYIPPRCRNPQREIIIRSQEISSCQGSAHYEATVSIALDYLRSKGLECSYHYGRMD